MATPTTDLLLSGFQYHPVGWSDKLLELCGLFVKDKFPMAGTFSSFLLEIPGEVLISLGPIILFV